MNLKNIKDFLITYKRRISAAVFFSSFAIDLLFLPDSASTTAMFIVGGYLIASVVAFWVLARVAVVARERTSGSIATSISDFAMQFVFGALASAIFVFYFRGAEISSGFLFLSILLVLLAANEFDHTRITKLEFRFLGLLVFAYSFALYVTPIFFGGISVKSTSVAYVLVFVYAALLVFPLRFIAKDVFRNAKHAFASLTIALFILLPLLVHFGIVPPLPYVLREGRVVSSIVRVGNEYRVQYEQPSFIKGFNIPFVYPTYHVAESGRLMFYTAITAPADLRAIVTHVWERKSKDGWVTVQKQELKVAGGRKTGFRTYSEGVVSPGLWRVTATLGTGQVLGGRTFHVAPGAPLLVEQVK